MMTTQNELCENTMNENEPILLTAKQVAYLLGLSERSVWRLSEAGKLPAPISLGRSKRWQRKSLDNFVAWKVRKVKGERS